MIVRRVLLESYRLELVTGTEFGNGTVGLHTAGTAEPAAAAEDSAFPAPPVPRAIRLHR
ncbi:hypothetical protein GCM10023215_00130 [Pseudonocardia yuanmonensis]|uniref:Uncharacterized protein n=1 Tax=Pseudonocardia yuanmonensis TaxID=1095914 RepID=A0ABP8VVB1_9PSEU